MHKLKQASMDEIDNLNMLVIIEFYKLCSELDNEKRKYINPKSIENIIYYLIENPEINPKKNQKRQELGEIRIKKKLLEYFKAIRNTDLDEASAIDLYRRYFMRIGEFMTEYYSFSSSGGKNYIVPIFVLLTIGVSIDTFLNLINWISYPLFTIMFLSLYLVRRIVKFNRNKQYGIFY